MSKRYEVAVSV